MIKKLVLRIFRLFGFTVVKLPPVRHLKKNDGLNMSNQPLFIYFLGPSGVGKTTLLNKAKQLRKKPYKWITCDEFLKSNRVEQDNTIISDVFEKLAEMKLEYLYNMQISATKKLHLLAFHKNAFETNRRLRCLNQGYSVLVDEGIFQVSGSDILSFYKNDKESFNILARNSLIIFCTSTAKNIVDRLEKRDYQAKVNTETSKAVMPQKIKNQEKLVGVFADWQEQFQKYGIPVLEIDTSEDLLSNAAKMNTFIERAERERY